MTSIIQTYINIYFTEIIVGVLIFSIIIVLISIFYVLLSGTDDEAIKKSRIKNQKKIQKMKYTKQFIKGVDGIDLDLKVNNKKTYRKI
jgi:hypothetical protein